MAPSAQQGPSPQPLLLLLITYLITNLDMASYWISDRCPTETDGDCDGDVSIKTHPDHDASTMVHWRMVVPGMSWRHTTYWTPPSLPGINGQWIDGACVRPHASHADDAGDVQARSTCGDCVFVPPEVITANSAWRPAPAMDKRPLTLAGGPAAPGELPGQYGGWINGAEFRPGPQHADEDGDVHVLGASFRYMKWHEITHQTWRPRPHLDPRPQR